MLRDGEKKINKIILRGKINLSVHKTKNQNQHHKKLTLKERFNFARAHTHTN